MLELKTKQEDLYTKMVNMLNISNKGLTYDTGSSAISFLISNFTEQYTYADVKNEKLVIKHINSMSGKYNSIRFNSSFLKKFFMEYMTLYYETDTVQKNNYDSD